MSLKEQLQKHGKCTQPDRHEPKMLCGYSMPCPFHPTFIEVKPK